MTTTTTEMIVSPNTTVQKSEKQECFDLIRAAAKEMYADEAIRILEYIGFNGRVALAVGWDYNNNKYTYKLRNPLEYLRTVDHSYPIRRIECVFSGGAGEDRELFHATIAELVADRLMCMVDHAGISALIEVDNACHIGVGR